MTQIPSKLSLTLKERPESFFSFKGYQSTSISIINGILFIHRESGDFVYIPIDQISSLSLSKRMPKLFLFVSVGIGLFGLGLMKMASSDNILGVFGLLTIIMAVMLAAFAFSTELTVVQITAPSKIIDIYCVLTGREHYKRICEFFEEIVANRKKNLVIADETEQNDSKYDAMNTSSKEKTKSQEMVNDSLIHSMIASDPQTNVTSSTKNTEHHTEEITEPIEPMTQTTTIDRLISKLDRSRQVKIGYMLAGGGIILLFWILWSIWSFFSMRYYSVF